MLRSAIILILLIVLISRTPAQHTPPQERTVKLFHYSAELVLDPRTELLGGTVLFDIRALREQVDSVVFYTPDMQIQSVGMKGYNSRENYRPVRHRQAGKQLILYPKAGNSYPATDQPQYTLEIRYLAQSPKELHFTGWHDPGGLMRKQVWAHRPFGWIPFLDQMTTQDIRITFDKNYQLVTNGERISSKASGDTALTWHYRLDKPHPFYSVCLAAGDYAYKTITTGSGIAVELWYYPGMEDRIAATYRYQAEMFDFLEKETGFPYPYRVYRNIPVADYLYGGMETTTSTVFADFMLVDERAFYGRNYINVNIHELAHQWFGNCINDKTVDDLWLTESFATYYAKMFEKQQLGEYQYETLREQERQKALAAATRNRHALGSGSGGVERWYQKGSLVMDMLRDICGETAFREAITHYLKRHAYGEAESNDLLQAIYETSGLALDWFFEQWIYRGGEPAFRVGWENIRELSGRLVMDVDVEQVQVIDHPGELFRVPLTIEVYDAAGRFRSEHVIIREQHTKIRIPVEAETRFLVFDAGNRILKTMQFERSFEQLGAQAEQAIHVADRLEAVRALQSFPADMKRQLFSRVYEKESFHLIRNEILSQLATDSLSSGLFSKALNDTDARVRQHACECFDEIPSGLLRDVESLLRDSSYFIVEAALTRLCNTFSNDRAKLAATLEQTKTETGWRGRNIRMAWLGQAVQCYPERGEFLEELIAYASPSYDFETRLNAFNQLKSLNYLDKTLADYLQKARAYWNPKLSGPAGEIYEYYFQQAAHRKLLESLPSR
ncbi:MAG TPA: M1 family aminopeptidase [Bacteroidales bacterium]|nr:M1 family aminopeptidase [Bacteroidales bacterium]HSA43744.1 M1 family aminopeptidase [Bacteroidales bacterium]